MAKVQERGYARVDQELEIGLRSIAVPVVGRGGVIGAINIGTQSSRVTLAELRSRYLPVLQKAARDFARQGL